jgi:hypothetical protein
MIIQLARRIALGGHGRIGLNVTAGRDRDSLVFLDPSLRSRSGLSAHGYSLLTKAAKISFAAACSGVPRALSMSS